MHENHHKKTCIYRESSSFRECNWFLKWLIFINHLWNANTRSFLSFGMKSSTKTSPVSIYMLILITESAEIECCSLVSSRWVFLDRISEDRIAQTEHQFASTNQMHNQTFIINALEIRYARLARRTVASILTLHKRGFGSLWAGWPSHGWSWWITPPKNAKTGCKVLKRVKN